ncbi:hypothetical protein [Paludibaculum fermentans]|uniref:DUF5667 domain-containing protein n=1 Tax=Paludibaculum fermentans TaxID=1473598 RepID=A0A7S7NPE1_PALFE|nr:hypothetical protein [Paludibaculum fermentans]QOY87347.1 hypothetical protein IRI77_32050 [Paludibaculum fermentans]
MRFLLALLLLAAPLAAQKDFLTADETDQVRIVQDPDERLALYVKFAQQRISLLDQLFAKQKAGRSGLIHDTLEQYTEIMDAIDSYIDNSIHKQKPPTSMGLVAKAQKEMVAQLEKFAELDPPDKGRYQFALDQAIETTKDSVEINEQDLKTRTHDVEMREAELKKQREELLTPQGKEEAQKQQTRIASEKEGVAPGKKKPSLLKPGEKLGESIPDPKSSKDDKDGKKK